MSKVLITSDIHIHDFKSYNLFDDSDFRLNQFRKLGKRLVDIGKEYSCEYVCIGGDVLHTASPKPKVMHAAYDMLISLSELGNVYITPGQHDLDTRGDATSIDTLLSLTSHLPGVEYVHKEIKMIGGRSFYFQGWTPEYTIDTKEGADILIGHATVPGSFINQYNETMKTGQDVDASRFKLAFLGDIHYHQVMGNIVIPGVPIQNNFNDHPDVGVIILDTETLEWERVSTITETDKFLQLIVSEDETLHNDDPYVIVKTPKTSESKLIEKKTSYSTIEDIINSFADGKGLTDIHSYMMTKIDKNEHTPIDVNFEILSLSITNFKSIAEFHYSNTKGVNLIQGLNGSGKSSLVQAIMFAFLYQSKVKPFVKEGTDRMFVEISFVYKETKHMIRRGWKKKEYIEYFINEDRQSAENLKTTKDRILEDLSFLNMHKLFYHDQHREGFMSSYKYSQRVDLLKQLLGLDIIESLFQTAKEEIAVFSDVLNTHELERNGLLARLDLYDKHDFSILGIDYDSNIKRYEELRVKLSSILVLDTDIESSEKIISNHKSILEDSVKSIKEINNVNVDEEEMYKNSLINISDSIKEEENKVKEKEEKINEIKTRIIELRSRSNGLINDINRENKKIPLLKSQECYVCNQTISNKDSENLKIEVFENIHKLKKEKDDIIYTITSLENQIAELTSEILEINKTTLTTKKELKLTVEKQLGSIQKYKESLKNITRLQEIIKDTNNSLHSKVIKRNDLADRVSDSLNIREQLRQIDEDIGNAKACKVQANELKKIKENMKLDKERLTELVSTIEGYNSEIDIMKSYMKLISPTGDVYAAILDSISEILSTDMVRVKASKTLTNGIIRPDFNLEMLIDGKWRLYDNLSGGQQVVSDLSVLCKFTEITGGIGMLILDETLKFLDRDNTEIAVNIIKDMKCPLIFIVSHLDGFPYYDNIIKTDIINGDTVFNII